jgi:GNAT superfamily N-acetyltransferase
MMAVVVRPPSAVDIPALALLLGELGYPSADAAVEGRLGRLAARGGVTVLVADDEGAPVGFATAHIVPVLHQDRPAGMLTALVVSSRQRGQGIGRRLVDAVEEWAKTQGAYRMTLASGLHREGAHLFYERLGYEHTARRYSKLLGGAG